MDLVDYSEEVFNQIREEFSKFSSRLGNIVHITFIPISALHGDNVVNKSENMPWFQGSSLLYHLETVYIGADADQVNARFPVQWVVRPHSDEYHDFRGYAGRVSGGVFKPGDEVLVMPSGFKTRIKAIFGSQLEEIESYLWQGELNTDLNSFSSLIERELERAPQLFGKMNKSINKIAWCTGGAQGFIDAAVKLKVDLYLSGEVSERTPSVAKENGITYISAGHHATERYGVQSLCNHLCSKFKLQHQYIEVDNSV